MSAVEALERGQGPVGTLRLDVVIPVYNEERALGPAVVRLTDHLARLPWQWQITIADNASTDTTPLVAHRLAHEYADVRVVSMPEKGRGRALKRAWSESDADVLVYMDVDLSTDLNALLPLVAPLLSGHSDLAIGSRLTRRSRVVRGPKRELISRTYNVLLRSTLRAGFSDAQCGFKAIRRDVAVELLPQVEDDSWFFDTELLVLAERAGLRIHEVPVDWVDDPDSRVDIVRTALDDLRGIARLAWSGRSGAQLVVFAMIGVVSTVAYAVLFLALRQLGPAQTANVLALLITAVGNLAANRRLTFGVRGRGDRARHHLQGLLVFAVGLAATSTALAVMDGASHRAEVVVLTLVNLGVTVGRFLALRLWVFRSRPVG